MPSSVLSLISCNNIPYEAYNYSHLMTYEHHAIEYAVQLKCRRKRHKTIHKINILLKKPDDVLALFYSIEWRCVIR